MATAIDTLTFAERFESAGFEHVQARALASAFAQAHDTGREELVTRPYLDTKLVEVEARLAKQLTEMEARLLKAINDMGQGLRKEQSDMDVRLTRQIGETGNAVQSKLWLAVVGLAGLAAAISAVATLLLK